VNHGEINHFVFRHLGSVTDVPTHLKQPKCEPPAARLRIEFSGTLKVNYDATHSDRCCETRHFFETSPASIGDKDCDTKGKENFKTEPLSSHQLLKRL
jgi:hypothetical protein